MSNFAERKIISAEPAWQALQIQIFGRHVMPSCSKPSPQQLLFWVKDRNLAKYFSINYGFKFGLKE
jgi:hypothetical protein